MASQRGYSTTIRTVSRHCWVYVHSSYICWYTTQRVIGITITIKPAMTTSHNTRKKMARIIVIGTKIRIRISSLGSRRRISFGFVENIFGIILSSCLIYTSSSQSLRFLHGSFENQEPQVKQKDDPHLQFIYWHPSFFQTQDLQVGHLLKCI